MSHGYRERSLSKPRNSATQPISRSNTPSSRNISKVDSHNQAYNNRSQESEPGGGDDYANEELDPRVQDELERLNSCTDDINQLENELEDANCLFRVLLTDSTHHLKSVAKKTGTAAIEKARPYYEALELAKTAQKECQAAATAYQRAFGVHAAAKETIMLAEQRFLSNSNTWEFDNAWQEMLNHATIKVMAAEKQKTDSEAEHFKRAASFTAAEQEVQRLHKKLQRYIQTSQPYFEQKDIFNKALDSQKKRVQDLQEKVSQAKAEYSQSLHNLEEISESIHARRKLRHLWSHPEISTREPGVGAELEYDLDQACDRASSRSTTSGRSASKAGSDYESLDLLSSKMSIDDSCLKISDIVQQFEDVSLSPQLKEVKQQRGQANLSRAASSPALHQLRQHMAESSSSIIASHLDIDKPVDTTVDGFQTASGARIVL